MFNQPQDNGSEGGGGVLYFRPAEHLGNLILFETVIEAGREFDQMAGAEREFRIVSYIDLDQDATPVKAKVTNAALVRKLPVGEINILGRIGQKKTSNGYNAWVLQPHTPADAAKAKEWFDNGRPAAVDPFADDARKAQELGITAQQYAQLKSMGMINDQTTKAPY